MAIEIRCPECGQEGLEFAPKAKVVICPSCSTRIVLDVGGQVSSAAWLKALQEKLIPLDIIPWSLISEEAAQMAGSLGGVPDLTNLWLWRGFAAYLLAVQLQWQMPDAAVNSLADATRCLDATALSLDDAADRLAQPMKEGSSPRKKWVEWAREAIERGYAVPVLWSATLAEAREKWYEVLLLMILEVAPELTSDVALRFMDPECSLPPPGVWDREAYRILAHTRSVSQIVSRIERAKDYWPRIASRVPAAKDHLVDACVKMSADCAIYNISEAPQFLELAMDIDPSAVTPVVGAPDGSVYSGYWGLVFEAARQRYLGLANNFFCRILQLDPELRLSDSLFPPSVMDIPGFRTIPDVGSLLYARHAENAFAQGRVDDAMNAVDQILNLLTIELSSNLRPLFFGDMALEHLGWQGNIPNRWFRAVLPDSLNEHAARLKDLFTKCADLLVDRGNFDRAADYLVYAEYMREKATQGWDLEDQLRLACTYAKANRSYYWALKRAMLLAPERKAEIEKAARDAGVPWWMFQWCWLTRRSEALVVGTASSGSLQQS